LYVSTKVDVQAAKLSCGRAVSESEIGPKRT
jgi:hypothetical protein